MAHYYYKDGTSCYEVPTAKDPNKLRDTNLRDARKMNLLPSVTTVLSGMIDKPFLTEWAKNNVADAAVTMPDEVWDLNRKDPEALKQLIRSHEREIVEKARVFGGALHDAIDEYLSAGKTTLNPELAPYMAEFALWSAANIERIILAEGTLVAERYAGRFDLVAVMKDGRVGMLDFKTRKRAKPTTKAEKASGLGKFGKYETDLLQLGAYRQAAMFTEGLPAIEFAANVFVDSGTTPTPVEMREYPLDEMDHAVRTWNSLNECWILLHKYDPAEPNRFAK